MTCPMNHSYHLSSFISVFARLSLLLSFLLLLLVAFSVDSHVPFQSVLTIEAARVILASFVWALERTPVFVHAFVMPLDVFGVAKELAAVRAGVLLLLVLARSTGTGL